MSTSAESAARFQKLYTARGGQLNAWFSRSAWVAEQFRSIVLDSIGTHVPKTFAEIRAAVTDDYGEVGERRLYRALRKMVANGLIDRTDSGYVRRRQ